MRCILCGGEMRLVQSHQDESMTAAGYAHQELECTSCHEVETRTVLDQDGMAEDAAGTDQPPLMDIESGTLAASEDDDADHGGGDAREPLLENATDPVPSPPLAGGGRNESARSLRARISGPSRFVRIRRGSGEEAGYGAIDTRTGMTVLRHQDGARLHEMCEWLGWGVTDDDAAEDQSAREQVPAGATSEPGG
jgi:hypothetical protein